MNAQKLSYHEMTLDPSGSIMSKAKKESLRRQQGYCLTCSGVPVLLVDIQKSKLNPLWCTKKPRTAEGEALNGKCLICNPSLRPVGNSNGRRSVRNSSDSQRGQLRSMSGSDTTGFSSHSIASYSSLSVRSNNSTRDTRGQASGAGSDHSVDNTRLVNASRNSSRSLGQDSVCTFNSNDYSIEEEGSRNGREHSMPREETGPSNIRNSTLNGNRGHETQADQNIGGSSGHSRRSLPSTSEHSRQSTTSEGGRNNRRTVRSSRSSDCIPSHASSTTTTTSSSTGFTRSPPGRSRSHDGDAFRHYSSSYGNQRSAPRRGTRISGRDSCNRPPAADSREPRNDQVESIGETLLPDTQSTPFSTADNASCTQVTRPTDGEVYVCPEVNELKVLVESMKDDDDQLGILTEIVVGSMETHESLDTVQLFCLETMAEIFLDSVTDSEELIRKIIDTMKRFEGSIPIQIAGCKVVCTLAENESNSALLVNTGTCEYISESFTRHIGDVDLVEGALSALRMLSVSSEARGMLRNLRFSNETAHAMQLHLSSAPIQRDGCALLSNISVDPEEKHVLPVSRDVLDAAVASLRAFSGDQDVCASSCFALKNFCYDETNVRALRQAEGIFDLLPNCGTTCDAAWDVLERLQMSFAADESLEEQALQTLRSTASADSPSAVLDVLGLAQSYQWSPSVIAACLRTLAVLASSSEGHRTTLQEGKGSTALSTCIEAQASDFSVQSEARALTEILRNVAGEEMPKTVGEVPVRQES